MEHAAELPVRCYAQFYPLLFLGGWFLVLELYLVILLRRKPVGFVPAKAGFFSSGESRTIIRIGRKAGICFPTPQEKKFYEIAGRTYVREATQRVKLRIA